MKHIKFNNEENERAKRLNDSIGTVTLFTNDCIGMMKAYFRDSTYLFGYLQFKKDYSRNTDCYDAFRKMLGSLKNLHKEMLVNYTKLKNLEGDYGQYSRRLGWLMSRLEKAESREEKA